MNCPFPVFLFNLVGFPVNYVSLYKGGEEFAIDWLSSVYRLMTLCHNMLLCNTAILKESLLFMKTFTWLCAKFLLTLLGINGLG